MFPKPYRGWYSQPIYGWAFNCHLFLDFGQFWFCIDCPPLQKKFFCPRVRTSLIFQYKHKYLEGRLACLFSKTTSSMFLPISPEPTTSQAKGFWPCLQYLAWIISCAPGLKCSHKGIGYPTIIVPLSHQVHILPASSMQGPLLGKFIYDFSPSVSFRAPFGNIKTNQHGDTFQVKLRSIFLCPVSKVCCTFNSWDLPSS